MFVKICGLTNVDDARIAVALGATHLGCVIVPDSPRCVDPDRAREVLSVAPPGVKPVLVTRGLSVAEILAAADRARVWTIQMHRFREEEARSVERAGMTVHRALDFDAEETDPAASADRIVHFDVGGGGSGRRFEWCRLGSDAPEFTFIAGGIRPDNVQELLWRRPWGIDVSSGVERTPGVKDEGALERLFAKIGATP